MTAERLVFPVIGDATLVYCRLIVAVLIAACALAMSAWFCPSVPTALSRSCLLIALAATNGRYRLTVDCDAFADACARSNCARALARLASYWAGSIW